MDPTLRKAIQKILHKAGAYAAEGKLTPAIELSELALNTMKLQIASEDAFEYYSKTCKSVQEQLEEGRREL